MIAPMIAEKNDSVAFLVLLAGPGVPVIDLVLRQTELVLLSVGATDDQVKAVVEINRQIYNAVLENEDDEAAGEVITGILKETGLPQEQIDAQVMSILSPWFRYFLAYDPRPALESISCPVLALFGSLDLQVDAGQNGDGMKSAFEVAPTTDFTVKTLPSLNHLFQTATTGAVPEYAVIEETIAPFALETITSWILRVTERP